MRVGSTGLRLRERGNPWGTWLTAGEDEPISSTTIARRCSACHLNGNLEGESKHHDGKRRDKRVRASPISPTKSVPNIVLRDVHIIS